MPWRSLALAAVLPLAACGALVAPLGHRVSVDSSPQGAAVLRGGAVVGTTPCEVEVSAGDRVLEVRLVGHRTVVFALPLVENPWVVGNVLTLGLGMLVDEALGTDRVPCTAPLVLRLRPGGGVDERIVSCGRQRSRADGRCAEWSDGLSAVVLVLVHAIDWVAR